jgi:putative peptidoglycan lipid II flippase
LGFVEKLVLAYFFGTGPQVDAYLWVYSILFSAYVVLREVVRPSFLPTFQKIWRSSAGEGWRLFGIVGTLLFLLLGATIIAGVLFAESLVSLAAPGFSGLQRDLAVLLTRLAMPALLFLGLSTLTTATLQAQKRFTLPALGDASFRVWPLILLLVFGGVPAMAIGAVLGALGKLVMETLGLGRALQQARLSMDLSMPPVRTVGRLAAPLLAALSLSLFVGPLVENAFATMEVNVGGVSALAFARKIAETLTTILPYTLGLVLLPFSAEMAAGQQDNALARTLTNSVRALTLLFLPATIGLMLLRTPFIRLLLERGAFTAESTQMVASPLFFYALALLPFALEVVVIQFFFARQDTLTPVIVEVITFVINVALIPLAVIPFGLGGIALAAATAKAIKVLALLFLFGRRVPAFRLGSLVPFAGKMLVASLATAALLAAWLQWGPRLGDGGFISLIVALTAGAALGGGTFFAVSYLLKVYELRDLWHRGRAWTMARISK